MKLYPLRLLSMSLAAVIFLLVFILWRQDRNLQSVRHLENEENEHEDGMQKAWYNEFLMTRDPALNSVPTERIIAAKSRMDEMESTARVDNINSLTWLERGPSNVG